MSIPTRKVNPEDDLGFGYQPVMKNQPLINKDGSPNVKRRGLPFLNTANNYHKLITMSWVKFWGLVFSVYVVTNVFFALIYVAIGPNSLYGTHEDSALTRFWEAFFFSAQTISTVGYGHINPRGMAANSVAAFESMMGLLAFALATGLLYGRFSRPSARIIYSKNILVAPYLENGRGLMFRLANLRMNILVDLNMEVIFSYNEDVNGKPVRRFFPLKLERRSVSILTLNWTVVHPLDDHSPLKDMTLDDLNKSEATFAILLKTFDDAFSQTVHSRTAYQDKDIIWGAKFKTVLDREDNGRIVLDLSKISDYDLVELPELETKAEA
ncbi:inward rectifier potassium channel [Mucilaginibacter mallensis]|uniref:Inward rectifier potassium channel n=1 Tax=Mucilaginibacter mallensis TaxID=652787 RepID=A0A1H1V3Z9_MUCMA|nr:ion channel [Mucilaginibacter mallensis]SDS79350.1 inward rectifier potassium channel [Mucilaginibacter mallensis]